MKRFLLYMWQLPQNLVGFAVSLFCKYETTINDVDVFTRLKFFDSAVSLGSHVIIQRNLYVAKDNLKHELGHSEQSKRLGWLYLLVVGIPSFARNMFDRLFHRKWAYRKRYDWYYRGYPEKWADELGNVDRKPF